MTKITLTCKQCGIKFEVTQSGINRVFCSNKCKGEYQSINRQGKNHPMWQGGVVTLTCKICKKEFKVYSIRKDQKFCSIKCYGEWMGKQNGENTRNYQGGLVILTCHQCGKEFKINQARKNKRKFCSRECMGEWNSLHLVGKLSASWKGGLTNQKYCKLFNESFKQLVRNQYHNKCFLCNKSKEDNGKNLSVHHVNYDKNCLCNGGCEFVPLCISCHPKTNFNRQTWEDLIMNYLYPNRYFMVN